MTLFLILAAAMVVVAWALLLPAARTRNLQLAEASPEQRDENLRMARERMAELEVEHQRGDLNDETFEQARTELKATLAQELDSPARSLRKDSGRPMLIGLLVLLPTATFALYMHLGSPTGLGVVGPGKPAPVAKSKGSHEAPSMEEMVAKLAKRLETDKDNAQGWFMLGRSYKILERYPEAVKALENAFRLAPKQPVVMTELADALAMTQGGRISGRPAELVLQVLEVDAANIGALWMAGQASKETNDLPQAVRYWRRAARNMKGNPQMAQGLRGLIRQTEAKLDPTLVAAIAKEYPLPDTNAPAPAAASPKVAQAGSPAAIKVKVSLDEALKAKLKPGAILFVFARATQGPPMPIAAARLSPEQLPAEVTLDDSSAMMAQRKLSMFKRVRVAARVSFSGQPIGRPGDLESDPVEVAVSGAEPVQLSISNVRQ